MLELEKKTMRTITLEDHYATPAFLEGPGRQLKDTPRPAHALPGEPWSFAQVIDKLCDLDDRRIADMDAARIDVQVLSLTSPGVEQLEAAEAVALARETNDRLADAVQRHPSRLAGFAALPTAAPDTAADELERTVREYGFKGACINGHVRGRYLDDPFFWPILERAETLQVPLNLHPTLPPQPVIAASYAGNFAPEATRLLAMAAWGWHIETAIHVLRLILGGAFDRYPGLQLVIGHFGETLPFMLPRLDRSLPPQVTKLERPIGAYLRENVHYTFSGFNYTATFLDLLLEVGVDRIMFSADYPYSSMVEARTFLDQLPVSPADKERIAHGNAERLLRL
ncbi:MAG: amidohydrolase family protein [Halobacteriota archaeon]